MLNKTRQLRQLAQRMQITSNSAQALLTPEMRARIEGTVDGAELDDVPLTDEERTLMAGYGAMFISLVLREEFDKLGLLVRVIYSTGVIRGRTEQD